jgi:Na+-transporting methylmalonyl-CoA/oxaloacetate decarboxylase gamma subunit
MLVLVQHASSVHRLGLSLVDFFVQVLVLAVRLVSRFARSHLGADEPDGQLSDFLLMARRDISAGGES